MLTSDRADQIKKQVKKEIDHKRWDGDIHRYSRYKNIVFDLEKNGRDASFWRDKMREIREKYPNVKNWP